VGFCVGVAIALQLISVYPKPEIAFATPPIEVQVAKDCDHMLVSKNNRIINQRWRSPPDITICPSSKLSVYRLEKATRFWKTLGHKFGSITKAGQYNHNCATGIPSYNEILVDIPSQDFKFGDHLGTTRIWWRTETGEILKSKIEIVTGWENSERIIEHEIGHALGFKDNNTTGHLMNKAWIRGGYNRRGLENNEI